MIEKRPKVGVAVFVTQGEKFLLQKRIGKGEKGTWGLPGGHLEFGESWEECAARETREEAGIEIKNVRFWRANNDIFEDRHYITLFMFSEYHEGDVSVMEPEKCEAWEWFEWDDLPSPLYPPLENLATMKLHPFKI